VLLKRINEYALASAAELTFNNIDLTHILGTGLFLATIGGVGGYYLTIDYVDLAYTYPSDIISVLIMAGFVIGILCVLEYKVEKKRTAVKKLSEFDEQTRREEREERNRFEKPGK
jgi:hypothetical protein